MNRARNIDAPCTTKRIAYGFQARLSGKLSQMKMISHKKKYGQA